MLRYDKQGLVALYDIRSGNGAGLFLQPRSPHGADTVRAIHTIWPASQMYYQSWAPAASFQERANGEQRGGGGAASPLSISHEVWGAL